MALLILVPAVLIAAGLLLMAIHELATPVEKNFLYTVVIVLALAVIVSASLWVFFT